MGVITDRAIYWVADTARLWSEVGLSAAKMIYQTVILCSTPREQHALRSKYIFLFGVIIPR